MPEHPKIQTVGDTLLLNFGQYGDESSVAAIAGDGRRVLTVKAVGVAEIWDARSGQKVGEVRPESPLQGAEHTAPRGNPFRVFIESAALNRDGSIALLGLNDGTAGTFRVSDGVRLATLYPPGEQPASRWSVVRAVAYSPDGSFVLVGFPGRAVGVWSEQGDPLVAFLEAPAGTTLVGRPFVRDTLVSSLAMSADNRWVFAGSVDMTATIWDVQTKQVVFAATEHAEEILALFDNAAGFGWATTAGSVWCSRDGGAPAKVLSSGEHWAEARFHGQSPQSPQSLLTRGFEGHIKHWNLSGQSDALFEPRESQGGLWSDSAETLAFHEGWILYPQSESRIAIRRGAESIDIERDAQLVTARFSPGGNVVATEGWKDDVELWSISDGKILRKLASPGGVGDFAFSADGEHIAIGEIGHGGGQYARHVFIYEVATGRELHRHSEHDWQVSRVAFAPDGRCLATLGYDVVIWTLDRRCVVARIDVDRGSADLRFLPDGRLLVLDQGRARVFRDDQKLVEWDVPLEFQTRWCISEDGHTLNIAANQAVVRFDLATGALRGTWAAAMPRPELMPARPVAEQASVRVGAALWRTEQGRYLHQSDGPRGWVQPLYLSPEGVVAIPADGGAAVVSVGAETSLLGIVPFEGTLRASGVVGGEILLVNERGQLFRHALPGQESRN